MLRSNCNSEQFWQRRLHLGVPARAECAFEPQLLRVFSVLKQTTNLNMKLYQCTYRNTSLTFTFRNVDGKLLCLTTAADQLGQVLLL